MTERLNTPQTPEAQAQQARANRDLLARKGVYALDLLASPGAGKTSVILATIEALRDEYNIAVIEGDVESNLDATKVNAQGIAAVQINTKGACHLDSFMIEQALEELDLDNLDLIIIENAGNLIYPANFDLGETDKAVILSVPEGDDKPLKHPGVFQAASAVVLNKVDTLPLFNFDVVQFNNTVARINPDAPIFSVCATKAEGVEDWATWVRSRVEACSQ